MWRFLRRECENLERARIAKDAVGIRISERVSGKIEDQDKVYNLKAAAQNAAKCIFLELDQK